MGNPRCVCGHEDRFHLDGPGMSNWGTESCECCDCKKFIHDKNAITLESQLTQLKADNAKLRDGLEECLMAFQAEDLLLDEKRVQALLEQTSQSPNNN